MAATINSIMKTVQQKKRQRHRGLLPWSTFPSMVSIYDACTSTARNSYALVSKDGDPAGISMPARSQEAYFQKTGKPENIDSSVIHAPRLPGSGVELIDKGGRLFLSAHPHPKWLRRLSLWQRITGFILVLFRFSVSTLIVSIVWVVELRGLMECLVLRVVTIIVTGSSSRIRRHGGVFVVTEGRYRRRLGHRPECAVTTALCKQLHGRSVPFNTERSFLELHL